MRLGPREPGYTASEGSQCRNTWWFLEQTEEGFSVGCPGLPGCWSQGVTEQEALENIRTAIGEYLAAVRDSLEGAEVREVEVAV
jgi:predicted RNase H-like HicB family nuclease